MPSADPSQRPTVLVVCFGNLCRSPMAEGLFRAHLPRPPWRVLSAGTHAIGGDAPTPRGRDTAARLGGIDIAHQRSSPLTVDLLRQSDHVFTMSRQQALLASALLPAAAERVRLLGAFAPAVAETHLPADPSGNPADASEIGDPMGGDDAVYEACFARLDECVRRACEWMLDGAPSQNAPSPVADWLTRP